MNYPRKKSASQGSGGYSNNNQQRNNNKPRFNNGGQNNRPRKNYGAMREKYLTQARDALSAGDRVLAENYFQHADHCFRMLAEENASRPQRQHHHNNHQNNEQNAAEPVEGAVEVVEASEEGDDTISTNVTSLPAFLTANYEAPKKEGEPVVAANWEEE